MVWIKLVIVDHRYLLLDVLVQVLDAFPTGINYFIIVDFSIKLAIINGLLT